MVYFHQQQAHSICQTKKARKYGTCRDPRCSLPCRAAYAAYWSPKLSAKLQDYQNRGWLLYFGTLKLCAYLTPRDYIAVRTRFQTDLRDFAAAESLEAKFLGISEIGDSLMVHEHYAMASTAMVSHMKIKSLWDSAAGGFPTIVYHQPMRNIIGTARYVLKDKASHQPGGGAYVYLFAKNTIRIRWGSKDFWTR